MLPDGNPSANFPATLRALFSFERAYIISAKLYQLINGLDSGYDPGTGEGIWVAGACCPGREREPIYGIHW